MKMLINRTGHEVVDLDSGFVAGPAKFNDILRAEKRAKVVRIIMDSKIMEPEEMIVGNIPPKKEGVYYIVSKRVADLLARTPEHADRDDFVYPANIEHENTDVPIIDAYGKEVRDSHGNIVTHKVKKVKGCHGFERPARIKI